MSIFSKKHYEWFANRIGDGTLDYSVDQFDELMNEFELDNPKFDRDIFIRWVTRVGVPKVAERFKPYLVVDNTAT